MTKKKNPLGKSTLKDLVLVGTKITVGLVPVIGGPLSTLIDEYIPNSRQHRLEEFLTELGAKMVQYDKFIKKEYITTDGFAYIFEEVYRQVITSYQKHKLHCLKGIFINSLVKDTTQEEKEYYLYLVGSLSELHLRILSVLNNPIYYFELYNLNPVRMEAHSFDKVLAYAVPNIDIEVVKASFEDLHQLGLTSTGKSTFGVMTAVNGIDTLKNKVSPVGKKFIEFCINY